MENCDVIVVGAGISGLLVARNLSREGKKVIVVEARNRIGGRIQTIHSDSVNDYVECGAEFIHGRLRHTMSLLKEYNIPYSPVKGDIFRYRNGILLKSPNIITSHKRTLTRRLNELKYDLPVRQFLELYFKEEEYVDLRTDIKQFVEGYDGADLEFASTFSIREEWKQVSTWEQYRIEGGYGALTDKLALECAENGCTFYLSCEVKTIRWQPHKVMLTTMAGELIRSSSIVVTCPLSVLQAGRPEFIPALTGKQTAMNKLKMGNIIKVHLFFSEPFWKNEDVRKYTGSDLSKLAFILSDAVIPTWWTQYPKESAFLTGWIPGPKAVRFSYFSDAEILHECFRSLSYIFGESEEKLRLLLNRYSIHNWVKEPYSRGAYNYASVDSDYYSMMAGEPVQDTIFFAGETFGAEKEAGLAEAAITSALKTAQQMLSSTGQHAA